MPVPGVPVSGRARPAVLSTCPDRGARVGSRYHGVTIAYALHGLRPALVIDARWLSHLLVVATVA